MSAVACGTHLANVATVWRKEVSDIFHRYGSAGKSMGGGESHHPWGRPWGGLLVFAAARRRSTNAGPQCLAWPRNCWYHKTKYVPLADGEERACTTTSGDAGRRRVREPRHLRSRHRALQMLQVSATIAPKWSICPACDGVHVASSASSHSPQEKRIVLLCYYYIKIL